VCPANISCTGYSFSFPFIDHPSFEMSQRNDILLYKMMFPPQIQPQTLAVIGCVETPGSAAVDGEMQSRYAARVFKVGTNWLSSFVQPMTVSGN
jgi:dimethylaniline monooxygenase (N-oxide forming)